MIFNVSRTSMFLQDHLPPCDGAVARPDPWPNDPDRVRWTLDVPDLDALVALVRELGEIVILPDDVIGIEIYDDFRE